MIQRVCIVGAGVIGSLFAGHLARVCEVSVLTRRREHADALNEHGLRVSGKSDREAHVTATDDPAELPEFDVAIVATKASPDTTTICSASIARPLRRFAGACTGDQVEP